VVVYPSTQLHEVTPGAAVAGLHHLHRKPDPRRIPAHPALELNEVAALEGLKMDWGNRVRLEAVRFNLLRLWTRT
jgi:hypothetical protein